MHLAPVPSDVAVRDTAVAEAVAGALAALRAETGLPAMFPPAVLEEARAAAERDRTAGRADRRDVPFVTIDPPGSMDLDQAVHVERLGGTAPAAAPADAAPAAYRVRYAIADVAAFVEPGGALDAETHERGVTVYGPDARTPLHPPVLSEGAASLLPDEDRPAALWTIDLDARGEILTAGVERAVVRSRARLTYAEVQAALDAPPAAVDALDLPDASAALPLDLLGLLRDVGRLRQERERERGGVSLDVPEQEVVQDEDGHFRLELRSTLPVEGWNAQVSLLTGIAAARIMREAGVGILRTLPAADPRDLERLRRTARALGVGWPEDRTYAELLATLDARVPRDAALLDEATSLFRGAGYLAFGVDGQELPDDAAHHAIAAEYAHVTAPLRRLVDRYGTEVCLAATAGEPVPAWVTDALPGLPRTMARTGQVAGSFERACVDVVEAAVLAGREGERFGAVVVDVDEPRDDDRADDRADAATSSGEDIGEVGEIVLDDPPVRARVEGVGLPLGERTTVVLLEADVAARRVRFATSDAAPGA